VADRARATPVAGVCRRARGHFLCDAMKDRKTKGPRVQGITADFASSSVFILRRLSTDTSNSPCGTSLVSVLDLGSNTSRCVAFSVLGRTGIRVSCASIASSIYEVCVHYLLKTICHREHRVHREKPSHHHSLCALCSLWLEFVLILEFICGHI
jgi:hypothetical protein